MSLKLKIKLKKTSNRLLKMFHFQAPQPTLDKAQALRVKSEDLSELSESETGTLGDADYTKQKTEDASDEEAARLFSTGDR